MTECRQPLWRLWGRRRLLEIELHCVIIHQSLVCCDKARVGHPRKIKTGWHGHVYRQPLLRPLRRMKLTGLPPCAMVQNDAGQKSQWS